MLYISKTTLTNELVKNVVEKHNETIENDYYNNQGSSPLTHDLPLAVASYIDGDTVRVGDGYTVTDNMVVYSTCRGNMIGVYRDWSDEGWFFFMSGRRHGIPTFSFFEELTPEYDASNTHVYISNNTGVSPFTSGVKTDPDNINQGATWPSEPTVVPYLLDDLPGDGAWRGRSEQLKKLLPALVVVSEEVPSDIAQIDLEKITVGVNSEGPYGSIVINGINFEGNISRIADYIVIEQPNQFGTTTIKWWFNDDIITVNNK